MVAKLIITLYTIQECMYVHMLSRYKLTHRNFRRHKESYLKQVISELCVDRGMASELY